MKRRTIVIMAFISAVLSLVFCLLSYFGVTRYFGLHMFSTESYSKNYNKLDKASDDKRVVISFTTTSDRVKKLKPMINSLLDQTVRVDEIAITVPYGVNIPDNIRGVAQVYNSIDYKGSERLIGALMREGEKDTKIIIINDNMVYGKNFIEEIIDQSEKYPDRAIQSKGAVLIVPEYFSSDVIEYNGKSSSEDWLKSHLKVGVKKMKYSENFKKLG